jgi:PhzF family phenazine biosynthesis protein
MRRRFQQVDVFGEGPFSGNPLAVVHDAEGLATDEMQRFTRWMNLSETVFLFPPSHEAADYRVRIFTLARELPFAGHPTLGACHAWLSAGGTPRAEGLIVQECGAGLVPVRRTPAGLAFAAPPLVRSGPVDDDLLGHLLHVLDIERSEVVDAQWVDNGPGWVGILLTDADRVLAVEPDGSRHAGSGSIDVGLVGPHRVGTGWAFEVRALFTDERGDLREDPVTGSLQASLAQWLLGSGRARAPYVARQGTRLGRQGRVHVDHDSRGTVWVGGTTTTHVLGDVTLATGEDDG